MLFLAINKARKLTIFFAIINLIIGIVQAVPLSDNNLMTRTQASHKLSGKITELPTTRCNKIKNFCV